MAKFKKSILEIMRSDVDLYKKLCDALAVQPGSLRTVIDRNGSNLNQYSIVVLVASHLAKDPDELVEKEEESEVKG